LARDHAGRLQLQRAALVRVDRARSVERTTERVDDTPEHRVADLDAGDAARPAHARALVELLPLADERHADVVLFEVESKADNPELELQHLERDAAFQAVHSRDTVRNLQHGAGLGEICLDLELLDPLPEDGGDLFRTQLHGFPQLLVSTSSVRSFSIRPRTLASRRSEPA
jgi:hypothetical protein